MLKNFSIFNSNAGFRRAVIIISAFVAGFATITFASWLHWKSHPLARHQLDYRINQLVSLTGKNISNLVLSDSVTEQALAGLILKRDVLDLTTDAYTRIAGNYFLLKRVLERNTVKEVDLFLAPEAFSQSFVPDNNADGVRYAYTDTVFTRKFEQIELRNSGVKDAERPVLFDLLNKSWREPLVKSLMPATRVLIQGDTGQLSVVTADTDPAAQYPSTDLTRYVNRRVDSLSLPFEIAAQNIYFLHRIDETCAAYKITCRIIIEPRPKLIRPIDFGAIQRLMKAATIIDANDHVNLPDEAFCDSMHFCSQIWSDRYLAILEPIGVDIFVRPQPWRTETIHFGSEGFTNYGSSGVTTPEQNGRWTIGKEGRFEIDYVGPEQKHLVFELKGIASVGESGKMQGISIIWDEHEVVRSFLASDGPVVLHGELLHLKPGKHFMAVRTSYAVKPPNSRFPFGFKLEEMSVRIPGGAASSQ